MISRKTIGEREQLTSFVEYSFLQKLHRIDTLLLHALIPLTTPFHVSEYFVVYEEEILPALFGEVLLLQRGE